MAHSGHSIARVMARHAARQVVTRLAGSGFTVAPFSELFGPCPSPMKYVPIALRFHSVNELHSLAQLEDGLPCVRVERNGADSRTGFRVPNRNGASDKIHMRQRKPFSSYPRQVVLSARIIASRAVCHSGRLAATRRSRISWSGASARPMLERAGKGFPCGSIPCQ